jgi:serine/threonine protein phosphatase PrpC
MVKVASKLESGGRGEDRLLVEHLADRTLLVVADGAGGTGRGAAAAQAVCDAAVSEFRRSSGSEPWDHRLRRFDARVRDGGRGGTSTAVALEVLAGQVCGASVGDSGAWLVSDDGITDLTELQAVKPLLGSGAAEPVAFGPVPLRGRLIVATDGLFKYARRERIASVAKTGSLEEAAASLLDIVRLQSGRLQDDVGLLICEDRG